MKEEGPSHLQLARFQKRRISRLVPLQRGLPLAVVLALVDGVGGHVDKLDVGIDLAVSETTIGGVRGSNASAGAP